MKDGFKGFYTPNGELLKSVWNSDKTIFVFDTNVFLNIYSYVEETKEDLFSVLEKIKDRLWIPNHVALEYQKRRLDVIDRERENLSKITNTFNKFNNQIRVDIIQSLGIEKKLPILFESLNKFLLDFNELSDKFTAGILEEQKKLKPDVRSGDDVRKKLDAILSGKIGNPFSQDELDAIYIEGEIRFSQKIPPGFRDASKGSDLSDFTYLNLNYKRKFGDLIIWKQLINESAKEEIENVIFVTDDKKNDWWYGVGDKIIGPQEKLQSEFYANTNVNNFKMYDTGDFLRDAIEYLGTTVNEKSLDDVKQVSAPSLVDLSQVDESDSTDNNDSAINTLVKNEEQKNRWLAASSYWERYIDEQETIRRAAVSGLDDYRNNTIKHAINNDMERYIEEQKAIKRAVSSNWERHNEELDAIRRAATSGLENYRKNTIQHTVNNGVERYIEEQEAIKRAVSNSWDRHNEELEAIRRAVSNARARYQEEEEGKRIESDKNSEDGSD
ncbi:PIN-like domain-containing protein [Pectobacterium brasiliense]|uniref:DUF4935 domain-containing protein n=1 Tax=Pectobacterium brasiliense TaxID=180957 RepID=A0A3S0ZQR0_9GAMM|nr:MULTISPECIES: PIN-like domain-containing protein [Pectobacterium]GKW30900.1 hypothetical protein PEC331060_40780 [Pectobacterium carotovorum subsp. carotovorum]MBN3048589.1 DUF4935 domain-containing protein [Pectobacterium brasiliense]MBN3078139.1 DUF4935 domain-containing protein [Pectobacterium brasiliense]MBN3087703.1 DUF4935 domain-containing protein [Pectobacterium brasiliense]MBN3091619.1 DUF4935 domain-containing protein [Pectobacterium brasiliense]